MSSRSATPRSRGARHPDPTRQRGIERGFTLLELMIVVTIIAILAGMGVPQYFAALRTARIGKAKHELVTISHLIASYQASHEGHLPLTLCQVGFGGRLDPWGLPYCYLNYGDGTGDGLDWAIQAGLVDPSAVVTVSLGNSGPGATGGQPGVKLGGFWFGSPQRPVGPATPPSPTGIPVATQNLVAVESIALKVARPFSPVEIADLVTSVRRGDSVFTSVPIDTTRRRDRYLFPLNTDYDLFSLGPNGRTTVSLGENLGQDDVIRANNGGFFGTASEY